MRRALVLACMLAGACGSEPEPQAPGGAGPRAALDKERRALADPEVYPLRAGMRIDDEALRQTLLRLRTEHGPQVAVAYAASIEALPAREPPAEPAFTEVVDHPLPDQPALRDAEALNWLFDADVHQTVQRAMATHLTLVMVQRLGMPTAEVGKWMLLLRAAEPTLSRCGEVEGGTVVCLDYGADVFVLELSQRDPGWIVQRLRWWQQAPSEGAAAPP